jgi:hypothetical protein
MSKNKEVKSGLVEVEKSQEVSATPKGAPVIEEAPEVVPTPGHSTRAFRG